MDAGTRISVGGVTTGIAVGALTGIATRNVTAALAVGGASAIVGGYGAAHVENVRDKYDESVLGTLGRPSVGISLAAGTLAGGAIGKLVTNGAGIGAARAGASIAAGVIGGGAIALALINGLGLD